MKKMFLSLFALAFAASAFAIISEDELLPPEQAFNAQARAVDASTVEVQWNIAEGYYLYRDKLNFSTASPGYSLGTPQIPAGKIKDDPIFGKVETFRHSVSLTVPVQRSADATGELQLVAGAQGCADVGVCYPPQKQTLTVALATQDAVAAPAAPVASALEKLSQLGDSLGLGGEEEFLPPDEAFAFSAEVRDPSTLVARWQIADKYYLYRDKFRFTVKDADGISLGTAQYPKGKIKDDQFIGRTEVFYHGVEVVLPLQRTALEPTQIVLEAGFQGCAEAGICYPPMTRTAMLALPAASAATPPASAAPVAGPVEEAAISEQDRIAQSLKTGNTLLTLLSFFGVGLLLAFTPCVFPMIPILSSIIVGQGEAITTRKAFTLSLVYVLAMALTYTGAGVIAGLFGENLQAAFQNPWIIGSFVAIFMLLALSMFGFYDLQLPSSWQSKLTELSNRQAGGTLAGVGIMGFLSALIVGPCVAAPLAGALIYIGQTGNAVLGGLALFALSLGMGAPLVAIGTSAGKLLPRAGDWMNAIKAVFGIALLAVGVWMLERIIPGPVALMLWSVLAIVSAVYLGALSTLGADATGWDKLWKGTGIVLLAYGVLLMIAATLGGSDLWQPLRGVGFAGGMSTPGTAASQQHLNFKRVADVDALQAEIAAASAQGKPAMLDFYADWCVECVRMEKTTFADAAVQQALGDTVLLQADVTANNAADKALLRQFNLIGPPAILFFGRDGQERRGYRLVGYSPAAEFQAHVTKALQ